MLLLRLRLLELLPLLSESRALLLVSLTLRMLVRVLVLLLLVALILLIRLLLLLLIRLVLLLLIVLLLLHVLSRTLHSSRCVATTIDRASPPLPLLLKVKWYGTLLMGTHGSGPMLVGRGYSRVAVVIRLLVR